MKLHTNHTNIERGGVQSESAFTIKTNALSFSILSSGLYTDPIMAIVRELSCNAYDAHTEAKNQHTPFEIHLPNDLEPFLSIKDFGTGLSDEDIQGVVNEDNIRTGGLYTTYFDSTKTNSNDYIGALGLGSKSPFSYSDAFEVISRFEGHKHTYAIFLNEEGIPTVALMGKIETDEHSGLEVKIAIKKEDFYKFKDKTAGALKYFPVKPKVTGAINFEFDQISEYRIETKEWMVATHRWGRDTMIAVQGNVAYRVNVEQVNNQLSDNIKQFVRGSNLVMFFDIGELEVSANREEIRYDDRSVEAIVNRIQKVRNEFTHEIEKKISGIDTNFWNACIELNKLSTELFNKTDAIRIFVDYEEAKNETLKRYIKNAGTVAYTEPRGYSLYNYRITGYAKKLKRTNLGRTVTPHENIVLVINDVKTSGINRLKKYLENTAYTSAIVITKREVYLPEYDATNELIKYQGFEEELKQLTAEFGDPDIHLLSKITNKIPVVKVDRLSFYSYDGLNGYEERISWEKTGCDIEDGGIYIPLKYGSSPATIADDGTLSPLDINDALVVKAAIDFMLKIYNKANDTDHCINDIYGLPTVAYKKVKKISKWINLFEYGKQSLLLYLPEINYYRNKRLTSNVLGIKDALHKHSAFFNSVKQLDDSSVFKNNIMPIIEGMEKFNVIKDTNTMNALEYLYVHMHGDDLPNEPFYESTAFNDYPMLDLVTNLSYHTEWSVLFDYIKLIDRSKK